uniref:Uncharacterized protein n=1 Tax=Nephila pilipes TaxID=299642 RepID=A0A8X6R0Y2_NEPPI|nr:hypothetical protein NPIL_328571 [Nephila pilipes]
MDGFCDSNRAQYERNRRLGNLVCAPGWKANGARLPSAGGVMRWCRIVRRRLTYWSGCRKCESSHLTAIH